MIGRLKTARDSASFHHLPDERRVLMRVFCVCLWNGEASQCVKAELFSGRLRVSFWFRRQASELKGSECRGELTRRQKVKKESLGRCLLDVPKLGF